MELYLSSYHLGNEAHKLSEMVGANKRAAIVNNALDYATDLARLAKSKQSEVDDLTRLGFDPDELDLKDYFGQADRLKSRLSEYGLLWVRGGNTFILRKAMKESGLDEILKGHKGRNDLVYGGYSAGVCVLAPSLKGIDLMDQPDVIPEGYSDQTIWEGVGLINYHVVPHYKSDHPESADADKAVEFYEANKMVYKTLKDTEVLLDSY